MRLQNTISQTRNQLADGTLKNKVSIRAIRSFLIRGFKTYYTQLEADGQINSAQRDKYKLHIQGKLFFSNLQFKSLIKERILSKHLQNYFRGPVLMHILASDLDKQGKHQAFGMLNSILNKLQKTV